MTIDSSANALKLTALHRSGTQAHEVDEDDLIIVDAKSSK
jgi:ribulose-5-phosphate 4-epimerase/fuculose-1-phosphate aldolase